METTVPPQRADTIRSEAVRSQAIEALRAVLDPELGVNVVDLGLIYDVQLRDDGSVLVTMTLTTPGCPLHTALAQGVAAALDAIPGFPDGEIRLVFDPPWDPSRMTPEGRKSLGWAE